MDTNDDPLRPSFFELAAQNQLADLLQPVLRYILSVFAQRHPRYLLRLVDNYHELYALCMYCIERHYLKTWSASFSEHFYNLKRRRRPEVQVGESAISPRNPEALRLKDIRLSLLFLIGIPYLKAKGQDLFERFGGSQQTDLFADEEVEDRYAELSPPERRKAKLKDSFRTLWPYLNIGYDVVQLGYNVSYIFDKTSFPSMWFQAMGLDLRRVSAMDLSVDPPWPKTWYRRIPYALLESLRFALPGSIFLFKLLEWWYSSASLRPSARMSSSAEVLPPIKPPPSKTIALKTSETPKAGQCPVCKEELVNATALNTSGWVCCYKCAWKYVSEHSACPVTGIATTTGDLRKIVG